MSTMARALLLCEIVARTIKNEINSLLRETMMKIRLPMEARFIFIYIMKNIILYIYMKL